MSTNVKKRISAIFVTIIVACIFPFGACAEVVSVNATKLLTHVEVSPSPLSESFVEGSIFKVPIVLNTKGSSVNGIEVHVSFDKNKLAIVQQNDGTSVIGVWLEPPKYDNQRGMASYVGVVPGGITAEAGFVGIITFKALTPGQAVVKISDNSRILLNDGLGTTAVLDSGRAVYTILPKAPEGVHIFSETHPFQDSWYNNNSPILAWDRDPGVDGFSFVLDTKPRTIPDNTINTKDTTASFENLADGLWYLHVKAHKRNTWGTTDHFLLRIDTTPPADFKPEVSYMISGGLATRTLVSFVTTDNLSGIDHYEIGIIDKTEPVTVSPLFVQAESPFQVPLTKGAKLRIIVRAFDKAGNIRDAFLDIKEPNVVGTFMHDHVVDILFLIIIIGFVILIFHYVVRHHLVKYLRRAFSIAKREELMREMEELKKETDDSAPEKPTE